MLTRPASSAASCICRAWSAVSAKAFSHMTWRPAARAAIVIGKMEGVRRHDDESVEEPARDHLLVVGVHVWDVVPGGHVGGTLAISAADGGQLRLRVTGEARQMERLGEPARPHHANPNAIRHHRPRSWCRADPDGRAR